MTKAPNVILENARIIDCDKGKAGAPVNIRLKNGRVYAISETAFADEGEQKIDLQNSFVMPGLIDCHAHPFLADTNLSRLKSVPLTLMTARATNILRGMIMRGFTTIRDASGGDWGIKQAIEDRELLGPRMFISGRALSQTGGHGDFRDRNEDHQMCSCGSALAMTARVVDGVDDIRKAVREELRKGADQIKIMVSGGVSSPYDPLERDQYSRAEIRTVVEEATRRGTYVMAHAYGESAIKVALSEGVRSIEHGNFIDEEAAGMAVERDAFIVPTLVTYEALAEKAAGAGWSEAMLGKLERVRSRGLASIEVSANAGVNIAFGTDLLGDDFDRQSQEFKIRSQVQSNADILKSATVTSAKLLNRVGELGVIKEKALADLIALPTNPLEDLDVLAGQGEQIRLIMKDGYVVKDEISTDN